MICYDKELSRGQATTDAISVAFPSWLRCTQPRPVKSTGLPSRLLGFLTPSTGLLGGRTFLLLIFGIKKNYFYLFFVLDSLSDNMLAAASK